MDFRGPGPEGVNAAQEISLDLQSEDGRAGPEGRKDALGMLQRGENARGKPDKGTPEALARRGAGPFQSQYAEGTPEAPGRQQKTKKQRHG